MTPAVRYLLLSGRFTPLSLFAAGEQGGWWDPSDFSTMFQDSAGTTPVTAAGQPVGRLLDKSGRGNHRTQGTAASRPTLQQDASGYWYLAYDGVDDFQLTGTVDFSSTSKAVIWSGATKQADVTQALVEVGAPLVSGFGIVLTNAPAFEVNLAIGGVRNLATSALAAAPLSAVLTATFDSSAGTVAAQVASRVNGVAAASGSGALVSGSLQNAIIYFGRRGGATIPFNGREYGSIIRGGPSSATQIAQTERYIGSKMGLTL